MENVNTFLFIEFYLFFLCNFILLHLFFFFKWFHTDKPLDIAQNWSGVTPEANWYSTHESKTQPQPSELGRFIRFCSSWNRVLLSSSVHTSLANCPTSSTAFKYMINASAVETLKHTATPSTNCQERLCKKNELHFKVFLKNQCCNYWLGAFSYSFLHWCPPTSGRMLQSHWHLIFLSNFRTCVSLEITLKTELIRLDC